MIESLKTVAKVRTLLFVRELGIVGDARRFRANVMDASGSVSDFSVIQSLDDSQIDLLNIPSETYNTYEEMD